VKVKNKAEPRKFAKCKRTNTKSHAETKEEQKRKEKRDTMAVLRHRWKKNEVRERRTPK